MIKIKTIDEGLLLICEPTDNPYNWIGEKLSTLDSVTLDKTFTFSSTDLHDSNLSDLVLDKDEAIYVFLLATNEKAYFRINKNILGTKYDVLLSKQLTISKTTFIAYRGISIFSKIDNLVEEQIVIGEDQANSIPIVEFNELLKHFPTTTELNHYSHSRISLILKNYLETTTDAEQRLNNYLRKKAIVSPTPNLPLIYEYEVKKYEYIRDEIKKNLNEASIYSESDWQKLILKFILLIYPKYIAVLEEVKVKDYYSNEKKSKTRSIDISLIDTFGNLDVIEIKKPSDSIVLGKGMYRDNFIPNKELSGAIMQVEKYIFHLSKWGRGGEKDISEKHAHNLPTGMSIRITNPKAIIILGRSNDFTANQNFDFEVMKRKYSNILDIITYDDLLSRLDNIIEKFKKSISECN